MAGTFDIVVIGGGPGGYVAALRAAQLGARTAVVEKDRVGGTCLVRGCIPTKALLQSSELYTMARDGAPFGLVAEGIGFDWTVAQKRKTAVVDQLVKGVEGLLKAGGVTTLKGSARLAGKGVVDVGGDQVQARDIVIATGSAVAHMPLPGAELTIDSDQILELKEIPRRLAVIGGGVVGMEFAAMFAALGSKVTVLEMLPQVLTMVDADLVSVYSKHLAGLGGEIHTDSKVSEIVKQKGGLQVASRPAARAERSTRTRCCSRSVACRTHRAWTRRRPGSSSIAAASWSTTTSAPPRTASGASAT